MSRRLAIVAIAVAAVIACTSPADAGQWAGPGTERDYCAALLAWGDAHPEVHEFDGWPAYCRKTYPDLVTATTTTTTAPPAQPSSSPAEPVSAARAVAAAPGFTG